MRFEIQQNENGQSYVLQVANNNEVLNASESFEQHQSAESNILSVVKSLLGIPSVEIWDHVRGVRSIVRIKDVTLDILDVKKIDETENISKPKNENDGTNS